MPATRSQCTNALVSHRRKWVAVTSTAVSCFVVAGASAGLVGPVFEPMMRELGWSNGKTSSLATAYTLAYLLPTPLVGIAVDRFSPRVVMAFGAVLASGALLIVGHCDSRVWMTGAFALFGLGFSAACYVPSAVVITSWMPGRRALGMGIVMGAMSAGATLFAVLITTWLELGDWRRTVEGVAVLIILIVPIVSRSVRNEKEMARRDQGMCPRDTPTTVLQDLQSRPVIVVLISGMLFNFGMQAIYFHIVPLLVRAGYSVRSAGLAYGGTWLLSGLGSLVLGALADQFGTKAILAAALLCCAVGTLFLLGASITAAGIASVLAFVCLWGATVNSFGQLAPVLFAERRGVWNLGALTGLQLASAGVSGAIAPMVTGAIFDATDSYGVAIDCSAAAILLSCAGIVCVSARKVRGDPARNATA